MGNLEHIKRDIEGKSINVLAKEIEHYKDEIAFYLYIIKELHKYIYELLLKMEGDNKDKAKDQINELMLKFTSSKSPKKLEHFFEQYKKLTRTKTNNSIKHLNEKEKELKDIIKILTEAIASMSQDNSDFNTDLLNHSEKLKVLNFIDDIIKLKEGLKAEVDEVSQVVKRKSADESNKLKFLSNKVTILNEDLKKAAKASMTDKLSGAFNRLAFDDYINSLIDKVAMRWSTFSILMIDIDNFKNINDKYGHLVGDRVIIATVQKCKSVLRKNDFLARFGGEEFVVILDGSTLKMAEKKAHEICKVISSTDFVIDKEKQNTTITFTVSIGASIFKGDDTVNSVIERADRALYAAKNAGRNRVATEKVLK